jgi:hypothetical protein
MCYQLYVEFNCSWQLKQKYPWSLLLQISRLLSFHSHPHLHLPDDHWTDLLTPVMLAQRERLLVRTHI